MNVMSLYIRVLCQLQDHSGSVHLYLKESSLQFRMLIWINRLNIVILERRDCLRLIRWSGSRLGRASMQRRQRVQSIKVDCNSWNQIDLRISSQLIVKGVPVHWGEPINEWIIFFFSFEHLCVLSYVYLYFLLDCKINLLIKQRDYVQIPLHYVKQYPSRYLLENKYILILIYFLN